MKSPPSSTIESSILIRNIVEKIKPLDELERLHIKDTLNWINSGAPLFRIAKPAVPLKHLVAYFVILDPLDQKILLVDHKNAQLWLPTGGHVEENEHPRQTVIRECREELGRKASFLREEALFLTSTETVGETAGHIDVSLWYLLQGNLSEPYEYNQEEFTGISWFGFPEIPFHGTDPHLKRFLEKMKVLEIIK